MNETNVTETADNAALRPEQRVPKRRTEGASTEANG
ncbi:hypothetical protein C438_08657 [Haloferax denitrificans ATCC 35960]|uniref:Uncharacterized protein n=2 Tax=Haloferax TaxID=2251 RepID=M0I2R0_9EURY|nr:hypothetical protein C441_13660 [Haloferax sulfurifontis ATCC BAA-897]EMA05885.1 hypothetical protein C438_08657 [Haloferax denitrificans ATCC 35960]